MSSNSAFGAGAIFSAGAILLVGAILPGPAGWVVCAIDGDAASRPKVRAVASESVKRRMVSSRDGSTMRRSYPRIGGGAMAVPRHSGARAFARTRNPEPRLGVLDSGPTPRGVSRNDESGFQRFLDLRLEHAIEVLPCHRA